MSTSELAAFGLFGVSFIGYMVVTALIAAIAARDDVDFFGTAAWLTGAIIFAVAMMISYGK